jgi:hypothetical protein
MRRRPLNRPVAPAVAVAALVAVAVGVVAFAGVSRTGPEQAGNSPSASAPVSGTPGAPSPDHGPVLHGSPPPEPVATPDADQAALVAKGWTFRAVRTLGVSMAVPPGWVSASWGDGRITDLDALTTAARSAPRYKPFLDSAVTAIADGSIDLLAVDRECGVTSYDGIDLLVAELLLGVFLDHLVACVRRGVRVDAECRDAERLAHRLPHE